MNPRSIFDGLRVVHPVHGRGEVKRSWPDRLIAVVQFDDGGGKPETVMVRDLLGEPADMPAVAKPDLRAPLEIRRSIKPSDGGYDYAILAEIDGAPRCIGEAFEVVGFRGLRVDAEANARLWAASDQMLRCLRESRAAWVEQLSADLDMCCPHLEDGTPDESNMDEGSRSMIEATRALLAKMDAAIAAAEGRAA